MRGCNPKVVARFAAGGPSPCLRARRTQLVDSRLSKGKSDFWRRKGFSYRHTSETGSVPRNKGPGPSDKGNTVLGERGTHPSVSGLPSLGLGGPSFVRGPCVPWNRVHGTRLMAPFLRKLAPPPSDKGSSSVGNGVPVLPTRGTTGLRNVGTPPSEEGYPFLDDGTHVSRKIVSLAVPRRRGSPPSQSGSGPRVGEPGPGKRDSRPSEMGILVPRKWGYPSFWKG